MAKLLSVDVLPFLALFLPLAGFIDETMRILGTDAEEVLVERAKPLRNNAGPNEAAFVNQLNDMMANPSEKEKPKDVEDACRTGLSPERPFRDR